VVPDLVPDFASAPEPVPAPDFLSAPLPDPVPVPPAVLPPVLEPTPPVPLAPASQVAATCSTLVRLNTLAVSLPVSRTVWLLECFSRSAGPVAVNFLPVFCSVNA
jgi:hypothetical protein